MRIVSVYEITLDHYLEQKETHVGGISLNFAVHAKRSGATDVALISRVGKEDGQVVLDRLELESINTSYVQILEGKTACIDIKVLDDGERIFPEESYKENVLTDFRLTATELDFIQTQDILVTLFDSREGSHFEQLQQLTFAGKRVVDFGDWSRRKRELPVFLNGLKDLDIAFISGTEETIEILRPHAIDHTMIVVTLGAKGSVALFNGESIFQNALPVPQIVDVTGCGDAFQAAFTVHYFQTKDIKMALKKGAEQAALVLSQYGVL